MRGFSAPIPLTAHEALKRRARARKKYIPHAIESGYRGWLWPGLNLTRNLPTTPRPSVSVAPSPLDMFRLSATFTCSGGGRWTMPRMGTSRAMKRGTSLRHAATRVMATSSLTRWWSPDSLTRTTASTTGMTTAGSIFINVTRHGNDSVVTEPHNQAKNLLVTRMSRVTYALVTKRSRV